MLVKQAIDTLWKNVHTENMKEIIQELIELENYKDDEESWSGFEGYKVVTNQREIIMVISNSSSCCEVWGYFWLNDNPKDFIGAELNQIDIVDESLDKKKFEEKTDGGIYEGDVMFINLETNKGTLQFTLYNSHNGYYGHTAKVISKRQEKVEVLKEDVL